ncbi:MAG: L,D-transpeptidase family protein [Bauldia sp.]|nr:L,D-transpeptidase family protein [Bauldia sp.]
MRLLLGALIASTVAGAADAAQVRARGEVLPGPIAPDFSDYVALSDPLAAAVAEGLASGVADGVLDKRDAAAITAFYAERGDQPVWIVDGRLTPAALDLIARIERADEDGLDPSAYRLPWKEVGLHFQSTPARIAHYDLELSQAVVSYATQAYGGRVSPAKLGSNFGYEIVVPDADDVLGLVSGSTDPVGTLVAYNPPQPEFAALKAELARLRAADATEDTRPLVPDGALLKPGMSDPRVPVIRARLEIPAATVEPDLYDESAVAAVEDFQRAAGLRPDGMVGRNTLAALNQRGAADPVQTILVNMERWRWMPRYLGDFYVRVNIPEYELDIYRGGEVAYTTRVVVGKVGSQTPIFSDEMEHIVVNPYWNVPASIIRNELLPAVRNGSGLRGYQVYANIKGKYRAVDPRSVRNIDARKIQIRQPPGARNALGQVKFLFPNRYDVYLHDTPSKSLFDRDTRAFSHGCVRVMNPWDFAEALLSDSDQVSGAQLKKRVGGGESWVNLDRHIPVHITYFTAWVDKDGVLQSRTDVYGHDKRLAAALGLS